ncbi:membrane-associated protein, putative [Bodo saltans]|uniref:Membrane-associated protein, putative n=1 Tax=Bodo saltans TaxID=75058 RepID=A0A0S4KN88_BODSA|nr:membrane-associated protein, putative [Bodo saltans]|eukprot:CUI15069.1 membrane-associated protein, putative [Bodo saltans]
MAVGLLLSITPVVGVVVVWIAKAHGKNTKWSCIKQPTKVSTSIGSAHILGKLKRFIQRGLERRWKWHFAASPSEGTPPGAQVLLLEYRLLWYCCFDSAILFVVAALSIASGLDQGNLTLCRSGTGVVLVLLVVQLSVVIATRPFTSLLSYVATIISMVLTFLSVVAQLIVASSTSPSVLWLMDASLICILGVGGVSACKMATDTYDLAVGLWRRWTRLCSSSEQCQGAARQDHGALKVDRRRRIVAGTLNENEHDHEFLSDMLRDDLVFESPGLEMLSVLHDDDAMKLLITTDDHKSDALDGIEAMMIDSVDNPGTDDAIVSAEQQFWSSTGTALGTARTTEDSLLMLPSDVQLLRVRKDRRRVQVVANANRPPSRV